MSLLKRDLKFKFYIIGKNHSPRLIPVTDRSIKRYRTNRKTRWNKRHEQR